MRNKENHTPEKLLIDTYKHIDQARNKMDQLINYIGSRQTLIHHLPDDVYQLVNLAMNLPPEKRQVLRLFLESLQTDDYTD